MADILSPDGRYRYVVPQGDGNEVVYIAATMQPVWNRKGYEADHGRPSDAHSPAVPDPPVVAPVPHAVTGLPFGQTIRVTQASPFAPRMMSDRANAWISGTHAFVFAGSLTIGGPLFFQVDLETHQVRPLGPKLPYGGETEGWFWLPNGRLVLPDGPRLRRVNPFTSEDEIVLDISDTHPGHDLWQPHASDDGQTYSATVRQIVASGKYPYVGTIIEGPFGRHFEPAVGQLDETQVTRAGTHAVIKQNGEDNRIIDLATGEMWDLADAAGAIGHSDCGPGFIVGESNLPGPGRCVKFDLRTRQRTDLFATDNMGYVSVRNGVCVNSDDTHLWRVALDGSGRTPIVAHGATDTHIYDNRPKANLDPTGRIACYMVGESVYLVGVA